MKVLLVLLLGVVLTCQGVPLNEESELEDAIQMDEPEIENEQNEAFGDDMSEYEEDEDTENDEEEEDTEVAESDPAEKKKKKKKPKKKLCPLKHLFCRGVKTCNITYKKGKAGAKCKANKYCVCSKCPKKTVPSCHFTEKKNKKGLRYSLECKCRK